MGNAIMQKMNTGHKQLLKKNTHRNGRDYFTNNNLMSAVRSSTNPFELSITKSIFYLSLI